MLWRVGVVDIVGGECWPEEYWLGRLEEVLLSQRGGQVFLFAAVEDGSLFEGEAVTTLDGVQHAFPYVIARLAGLAAAGHSH
jgi:hypothetical protein